MPENAKFNKFSVPLGLLDYVNPIFYTITMVAIIKATYAAMGTPCNVILLIGAIISILFGFVIPTGKVLVGLGIIKFVMPVPLVACVNTGILISGLMLFDYVLGLDMGVLLGLVALIVVLLVCLYIKTKKPNTIAVLTGAFGYLLIYASLIVLAARWHMPMEIALYAIAILLFIMLCGIGIKADLKNPKVHWVIEISNVVCQFLVALSTVMLFSV
ncbi:MAG: hypothetical protein IKE61_01740 [Coriobacteriales bacterium]|nr:hypothetical protein [Coriobacteriales bacterium]